jgi:hypothetical protein
VPVIGPRRAKDLVRAIGQLDSLPTVRALRPLLQA